MVLALPGENFCPNFDLLRGYTIEGDEVCGICFDLCESLPKFRLCVQMYYPSHTYLAFISHYSLIYHSFLNDQQVAKGCKAIP